MHRSRLILGEYRALEGALWDTIDGLQDGDPLRPITVVAPSRWLVRHLKLAALRRFPEGLFSVRFVNFFQYALSLAGDAARTLIGESIVRERILLDWIESLAPGEALFTAANTRTYDLAGALAAAVRDLRDAAVRSDPGIVIERLGAAARGPGSRLAAMDVSRFGALLRAYGHYLDTLRVCGLLDRADVYRLAGEMAFEEREPLIFYGFYDMIQVQADLVAELGRHTSLTLFVPHGMDAETWRFGRWFRDTFAPSVTTETVRVVGTERVLVPEIYTAAGERDEVWFCAKEIRHLLDAGCQPESIVVTARTLDPYRRDVAEVFDEHAIPYVGLPAAGLMSHPLTQIISQMFRVALDDAPHRVVLDVVMHPLFRATGAREQWPALARALRIRGGEDWRRLDRHLDRGGQARHGHGDERTTGWIGPAVMRSLREAVDALLGRAWPDFGTWRDHANAHMATVRDLLVTEEASAEEASVLEAVTDVLRVLGAFDSITRPVARDAFLDAFDRTCRRRFLPAPEGRGVAVLDAMAVRGLCFEHVFVLGLNARVFPRFIVEEPFVSDAVRREVFRVLGHHLAVRGDGYDEERLLFHLVCAAATKRLVCTYQRADAAGRLRDPSPLLRPLLSRGEVSPRAVPHSAAAKRSQAYVPTVREQILSASDVAAALSGFGYDPGIYRRGVSFLGEIHGGGALGECEGYVGPLDAHWRRASRHMSPTRLERYAQCPFRYLAQYVLALVPAVDLDEDDDLTPREIGIFMHLLLERLYRILAADGPSQRWPEDILARIVPEISAEFEDRQGIPLRGLRAVRRLQIVRAVQAFAAWDLNTSVGWEPRWLEEEVDCTCGNLRVTARIDRIDWHPDTKSIRVIDYKHRFREHWTASLDSQAKRGQKLQGPVYIQAASAVPERYGYPKAEVCEAAFHFIASYGRENPGTRPASKDRFVRRLTAEAWEASRPRIESAITTLGDMMRAGWFFPHPSNGPRGYCTWCDFSGACRKGSSGFRERATPARTSGVAPYWQIIGRRT